jgi:hypothetical protein
MVFLNCCSFLKVIVKADFLIANLKQLKNKNFDDCVIVGTGPSFKEVLDQKIDFLKGKSIFCVNEFVVSEYFGVIKPDFYLLYDPIYWDRRPSDHVRTMIEKDLRIFKENVSWPITLIMPASAKRWNWFSTLPKLNKNIQLCYVNTTWVHPDCSRGLRNFLYKMNLAAPRAQTVLIGATFLAINMGYKKIFLTGADHSWHENIVLGQDNVLCVKVEHFYAEDDLPLRPFYSNPEETETFKTHELFKALSLIFQGHHEVAQYAKFVGASVYNASKKTFIDAYERVSL